MDSTFYACFHVRVALLKCDFLQVPCTKSWTSWAQMKAENLRNPKMVLHIPIAPSKLELLASKRNRAFFLGHPVPENFELLKLAIFPRPEGFLLTN